MKVTHAPCTNCGNNVPKDTMMVKKVSFHELGKSGKMVRSRTVDRLCAPCVVKDPAWSQKKWADSPGMRNLLS
jgi:hypothetical protein